MSVLSAILTGARDPSYQLSEAVAYYLDHRALAEGSVATWWAMVAGRAGLGTSPRQIRQQWLDAVQAAEPGTMTHQLGREVEAFEGELSSLPAIHLGRAVRRLRGHVRETQVELSQAVIMAGQLMAHFVEIEKESEERAQREAGQ